MKYFKKQLLSIAAFSSLAIGQAANAESITYFHNDALGSPIAATNSSGSLEWQRTYKPFGEVNSGETNSSIGYTGHADDADTGLTYMQARYYNPTYGRFLATDPVRFNEENVHSFNRYAYANNNPYGYVDPDGKFGILGWLANRAAKGAAIGAINGAVNAATQSYYDRPVGQAFVNGFVGGFLGAQLPGPAGGFVSGFITTAMNSEYGVSPSNFGDPLVDGMYGGVGGAVIGAFAPSTPVGAALGGFGELVSAAAVEAAKNTMKDSSIKIIKSNENSNKQSGDK